MSDTPNMLDTARQELRTACWVDLEGAGFPRRLRERDAIKLAEAVEALIDAKIALLGLGD